MRRGKAQITAAVKTKPGKAKGNKGNFLLFAQIENEKSELENDNQRQQILETSRRSRMARRQYV